MMASLESAETDITRAIDHQIQTWLASAPSQLADDAARPIEDATDRFSGRYLVLAARALPGDTDRQQVVSAAASVECLSAQMRLKAEAALNVDGDDVTRALLASDFLHSLSYAGVAPDEAQQTADRSDESIGQACYRSLSTASQRLTSCWLRSAAATESPQNAPIEPIVTATAGELAGLLEEANDKRLDALRSLGLALGFERWRQRTEQLRLGRGVSDDECPGIEQTLPDRLTDTEARDVVSMLPESSDRSMLGRFVDRVLGTSNGEA